MVWWSNIPSFPASLLFCWYVDPLTTNINVMLKIQIVHHFDAFCGQGKKLNPHFLLLYKMFFISLSLITIFGTALWILVLLSNIKDIYVHKFSIHLKRLIHQKHIRSCIYVMDNTHSRSVTEKRLNIKMQLSFISWESNYFSVLITTK